MIIKKAEHCIYCGKKMESITAKKRFCSDTCRVYFNRQKSQTNKSVDDLMNLGVAVIKTTKEEIKSVSPLSEEGAAVMSEYELRMAKERVEVLKKEIANPPQTKFIPIKKYIALREKELNELLSKIK